MNHCNKHRCDHARHHWIVPALMLLGGFLVVLGMAAASGCTPLRRPAPQPHPTAPAPEETRVAVRLSFPAFELEPVLFPFGSAALTAEAQAAALLNSRIVKEAGDAYVVLAGHADIHGPAAYNSALSRRRAAALRDYYLALDVPMRQYELQGHGDEQPLCRDRDRACHRRNRRVTTTVYMMEIQEEEASK